MFIMIKYFKFKAKPEKKNMRHFLHLLYYPLLIFRSDSVRIGVIKSSKSISVITLSIKAYCYSDCLCRPSVTIAVLFSSECDQDTYQLISCVSLYAAKRRSGNWSNIFIMIVVNIVFYLYQLIIYSVLVVQFS